MGVDIRIVEGRQPDQLGQADGEHSPLELHLQQGGGEFHSGEWRHIQALDGVLCKEEALHSNNNKRKDSYLRSEQQFLCGAPFKWQAEGHH